MANDAVVQEGHSLGQMDTVKLISFRHLSLSPHTSQLDTLTMSLMRE